MTAHAAAPGDAVVNAMSIDVEDYFQVSAFDRVVSRSAWDGMESRVSANTDRLLALFDEFGIKATFFVLAWVAERHPDIVRRIAAGGHEVASHGYGHRLIYEQTIDEFRDDVRARERHPRGSGGRARRRLSRSQLFDYREVAVGARRPHRGAGTSTTRAFSRSGTIATGSRMRRASRMCCSEPAARCSRHRRRRFAGDR